MNRIVRVWIGVIFCMVVGWMVGGALSSEVHGGGYTAEASIEALPPQTGDPMVFEQPAVDMDLYDQFRRTKAEHMKQQDFLEELLRNDKVRATGWFQEFQGNYAAAVDDLGRRLSVACPAENNFIMVTMTCSSKMESALIVNEAVELFLKMQHEEATRDIRSRLSELNIQHREVKARLLQKEDALETIRAGTEFTNLAGNDLRDYTDEKLIALENRHAKVEGSLNVLKKRLTSLMERTPDQISESAVKHIAGDTHLCTLSKHLASYELKLIEAANKNDANAQELSWINRVMGDIREKIDIRKGRVASDIRQAAINDAELGIVELTEQLEAIAKRRSQAKRESKELWNLRAKYGKFTASRDENQRLLEQMSVYIEKLNMLYNDPFLSRVKSTGPAPEPLEMSVLGSGFYAPTGAILGLALCAGLALLFRKPDCQE
ncbi:MAG: hypothetical protein KAT00_11405 [Planctomycetes bacterium]|nr:hypothetical protein [Planctomycetota bacterium]